MANKRKMSESTKLRITTLDLVKSDKPLKGLSSFRVSMEPMEYTNFIKQLLKFPNKKTKLPIGSNIRTLKQMNSSHLLFVNQQMEIFWAKSILLQNVKFINIFLQLSDDYTKMVLKGKYKDALKKLDEIEDNFGQSLWLIKNKIATLQNSEGLEAQKNYVNSIKDELNDNRILNFIVHWTSIRNEDNTSITRFQNKINKILNEFTPETHPGFYEYCKFHILGEVDLDSEKFSHVLRMDYSRSFIDLYESFIHFLGIYFNNSEKPINLEHIIGDFCSKIKDSRLVFLRDLEYGITKIEDYSENSVFVTAEDFYLDGQYEKAYNTAYKYLMENFEKTELVIVAGKSKAMMMDSNTSSSNSIEIETTLDKLIFHISKIYQKGITGAKENVEQLKKFQINYFSLSCSSCIRYLLRSQSKSFFMQNEYDFLSIISSAEFSPLFLPNIISSELSQKYMDACLKIYPDSQTVLIENSILSNSELPQTLTFENDSMILVIAENNYKNGQYDKSIKLAKELLESSSNYFRRKGIGLLTYSNLKKGNLKNTLIHIVNSFLKENHLHDYLPITELLQEVQSGSKQWDSLSNLIEFPIIWDINTKYFDSRAERKRSYAYEDFLIENNMNKPSELLNRIDEFEKEKVIYYLKEICIEQNMDTSDAFENGSKEVIEERLNVCRILTKIDKSNEELISEEISEIISRQVIAKNTTEFDNSRVQVDTASIKSWANKELEESFNRFQAYLSSGITIDLSTEKKIINRKNIYHTFNIPKDEVHALLKSMVEDIVDVYLAPEYGLDRFLSTRIRHGKLDRHMRQPLSNEGLITKRESERGKYLKNEFLSSVILDQKDTYVKSEIDLIASSFSKEFDSLISEIANEWIQIKGVKKPNGLFNFGIEDEDIINISKEVNESTSLKEFVDFVIKLLNQVLVVNLATIRETLNTEGKKRAKLLLTKLNKNLSKFSDDINNEEINDSINRGRTALQVQFDKIIGWFVPSTSSESPPFTVVDAIDVAIADLKEDGSNVEIDIDVQGEMFAIHGSLPHFVDIFINLFDNIHKRSGLQVPRANVSIDFKRVGDELQIVTIKINNEVGPDIDIITVNDKLEEKKELMYSGKYKDFIAKDRDSGIFKTFKAVSDLKIQDVDMKSSMDFGINERMFWVSISIPFKILSLELEEETKNSMK